MLFWPVLGFEALIIAQAVWRLIWPHSVRMSGLFDVAIGMALIGGVWLLVAPTAWLGCRETEESVAA